MTNSKPAGATRELIEYDDRTQPPETIKAVERLAAVDKADWIGGVFATGFNLAKMIANPRFIDLDPDPSASRHSSVAPSVYEEAVNPESAKDSGRYRAAPWLAMRQSHCYSGAG